MLKNMAIAIPMVIAIWIGKFEEYAMAVLIISVLLILYHIITHIRNKS